MKYIKSYILFVIMGFAVAGCTMDDLKDDVNDLKDRVTLIEQQVKLLNDNLAVIGYILDPQNKTVSKVETVKENGVAAKYVITLSDNTQLTLTIGKEGTVNEPEITIGDDGKWYINGISTGVVAVGENGKNGEGYPEFRVQNGNWQIRFGDGEWANVPGGEGIAGGSSLGDQIFESAKVDGSNFVVTLKDGTVHTLPIVATLVCAIDRTGLAFDDEDFLIINKGERVVIPAKIEGENPQVTYPQGWRATLNKLDVADEKGNNYQLLIFAPAAENKTLTRAAADNTADVTVQVQEGLFWAVDKIKVKNPKGLASNLDMYNEGQAVIVGGLEITKEKYGEATEVTADMPIEQGGVYFVSTNNVRLTYNLGTTGVDNLIIVPTTKDVTTINLVVSTQIYLKGMFACQNVTLLNQVPNAASFHYPLRIIAEQNINIVLDGCKVNGLVPTKGFAMKSSEVSAVSVDNFIIHNSDINLAQSGAALYLLTQMSCKNISLDNNLIYASSLDGNVTEFKIFNGNGLTVETLNLTSNTLIDIESSGASLYGLVRAAKVLKATVKDNLYWLSDAAKAAYFFTGASTLVESLDSSDNFGYSVSDKPLRMFQNTAIDPDVKLVEGLFNTTDPATFNKSTGTFIPKEGYTQYGAQR